MKGSIILSLMLILSPVYGAKKIYVSKAGNDNNPGSMAAPVKTLDLAMGLVSAGDTLFIGEGRWHEKIVRENMHGREEAPIVVTARAGERVIMDGTLSIESEWTKYEGNIYKTTLNLDIWQLFVDGQMMMPARWPNAFLHDNTVWDRENTWGQGDAEAAENGRFVDSPHGDVSLAASGIDANGAIAIMNIGSWRTMGRKVLNHSIGSSSFTYKPVGGYKTKNHSYYLEGKLELLDAAGEWFFDGSTNDLFLWMPDGKKPSGDIRGKVQSYVLNIKESSHIKIVGLDFFATTFSFENCSNITVEDCELNFPSCSKRMMGENEEPEVTRMVNSDVSIPSSNALINCSIRYTESQAISFRGNSNLVENCSFYAIDWVVADRPGLMTSIYNEGQSNVFRRNSVELCGASSTLTPGDFPIVEMNRITRTGFMQNDGSITQVTIGAQPGSQIRFNWFHNTIKSGARFDAPIPPVRYGHGGTMRHNVIWETSSGLMIKGEYHFCYQNTVLNCLNNGIIVLDDSALDGGANKGTLTRNNFSDKLSGDRNTDMDVPGTADHNWNGYKKETDFRLQINDYENLDFRPRKGSELVDAGISVKGVNDHFIGSAPDIGAYEFGDANYWIAGRQLDQASTPIPLHKGKTNYEIVDLMWLEGYTSVSSDIYFGTSEPDVAAADHTSPEYKGSQVNNIFNPGELKANRNYYWRIDAVRENKVIKGQVWSFTAGVGASEKR